MSNHNRPGPTLLIVDNRPESLNQWSSAGHKAGGFTLIQISSYEDALYALNNHDVDVLVTDLFLTEDSEESEKPSGAEGLRLIERCRTLHPRSRIVAITGILRDATEIGAIALDAGADDFISVRWRGIDCVALLEHKLRIYLKLLAGAPRVLR